MSGYFSFFPSVSYMNNDNIKDITRRPFINKTLFDKVYVFLPYTIKEDEKPEDVAYFYYDDPERVWIVHLSNRLINPYYDWPLSNDDFNAYIAKKYELQSGTTGFNTIVWTQNTAITSNILYYVDIDGIKINTTTFDSLSTLEKGNWNPVRIYDSELLDNENKRVIYLINKTYAGQLEKEMKTLLYAKS